jgi:hypothetical protein
LHHRLRIVDLGDYGLHTRHFPPMQRAQLVASVAKRARSKTPRAPGSTQQQDFHDDPFGIVLRHHLARHILFRKYAPKGYYP